MIFQSSEIRRFSEAREALWELYVALPLRGEGTRESSRTDYYLRANTPNTGVKIREGNHEIKVRSGGDEQTAFGTIQSWIKWSTKEERNILNTIDHSLLGDWIAIEKKRYKKVYEILGPEQIQYSNGGWLAEGCGVEFTEIYIPEREHMIYTLGLEAFGTHNTSGHNLLVTLEQLPFDRELFKGLKNMSYPELLAQLQ